jgi:hypothetical protein
MVMQLTRYAQALIGILGTLKLAVLILWVVLGPEKTKVTLAASTLNLLVVFPLCLLSYSEHVFRVAPSLLVELYVLLTLGFDIVRIRTLWFIPGATYIAGVECGALAIKLCLAVAEGCGKQGILQDHDKAYTTEQLSGLYSRSLFLWLGPTLWNGRPSSILFPRTVYLSSP